MSFFATYLALLLLIFPSRTTSKVGDLRLDTLDSWVFLDRFVFLPTPDGEFDSGASSQDTLKTIKKKYGVVEFEVEVRPNYATRALSLAITHLHTRAHNSMTQ